MLVVFRNPKDTLVSYYHFYKNNPVLPSGQSWDSFFSNFMKGEGVFGTLALASQLTDTLLASAAAPEHDSARLCRGQPLVTYVLSMFSSRLGAVSHVMSVT